MKPDQKKEQQAKCEHDYPKNQCELCNAVYLDMNKAKCEHECTCDVAGIRLGLCNASEDYFHSSEQWYLVRQHVLRHT